MSLHHTPNEKRIHGHLPMRYLLEIVARKAQFDFALVKLRKIEFPHHQITYMQLTCVTWLVSPNLLYKFKLEELDFSLAYVTSNL